MNKSTICVLGGTGFLGRHLCAELARRGHKVKILTRRRERNRDLLVLPAAQVIESDVHDSAQLHTHFQGCDTVINLVGIINERGRRGKKFYAVHMELARKVLAACLHCKVTRLLHMSALNAKPGAQSFYLSTKGEAENYVHTFSINKIAVTSFRPSLIFACADGPLSRFASMLRLTPWIFPLACADTKFMPVYVDDVVKAMVDSMDDPDSFGKRIHLCGPRQYTLQQIVRYIASAHGYKRKILALPNWLSKLQAYILEYAPGKPFSIDNYYALQRDSVCPETDSHCPTSMESIISTRSLKQRTNYNKLRMKRYYRHLLTEKD